MKRMIFAAAALSAAVVTFAASGPAAAAPGASFRGVVVARPGGKAVVVASTSGTTRTVHTASQARVGAVVAVRARQLRDGTFAASRVSVVGHARKARIRGVIVRRSGAWTFLSAGRSVVAVRSRSSRGLSSASAAPAGLQPGTVASVGVSITSKGLAATSMSPAGQASAIVIQATVTAVTPATPTAPGSITLNVGGQPLTITLPPGTVLPASVVPGATVTLTLTFGATGPSGQPGQGHGDDDDDEDEDDHDDEDEDDEDDEDEDDHDDEDEDDD